MSRLLIIVIDYHIISINRVRSSCNDITDININININSILPAGENTFVHCAGVALWLAAIAW